MSHSVPTGVCSVPSECEQQMPDSRRSCRKIAFYPSMSNSGSSGPAPGEVRDGLELGLRADA
eukprot:1981431-Lingulodinium_polyedra.AAC.1